MWETKPPTRSVTMNVVSLKPYRGTRKFSTVKLLAQTPRPFHARQYAQATNLPLFYDSDVDPNGPMIKQY